MKTSISFPKNTGQKLSKIFLLYSLVIVLPLFFALILLFFYNQIIVLIVNSEVYKHILIQFIFCFVLIFFLLDILALVTISVIGWLHLVVIRNYPLKD